MNDNLTFVFKVWTPYLLHEDSLLYQFQTKFLKFHEILLAFHIGLKVTQNETNYQLESNMHLKINTKYNWQILMNFKIYIYIYIYIYMHK